MNILNLCTLNVFMIIYPKKLGENNFSNTSVMTCQRDGGYGDSSKEWRARGSR